MRRLIGLAVMAAILFFVVGGLIYNVGGIRDKIANHEANSIKNALARSPTPTPTPTPTFSLRSGIYIDGQPGTPHYFVTLSANGDAVHGTLAFVAQDGNTDEAHPFSGDVLNGIVTLNFKGGSTGTASLSRTGFELGDCQRWMHFAESRSDCDFRKAAAIN